MQKSVCERKERKSGVVPAKRFDETALYVSDHFHPPDAEQPAADLNKNNIQTTTTTQLTT